MKPTLVIMAAGMGSRYGGIKQIDPMGPDGEILLDYAVKDALNAGFGRTVFVIRKHIEKAFKETVGRHYQNKMEMDFAFQELEDLPPGFSLPPGREKPWGTGQAVLACRQVVKEPFLVINADDFYGSQAFTLAAEALKNKDPRRLDSFLAGYRLENTLSPHGFVTRGVCHEEGGFLTKITERMEIGRREEGGTIFYKEGEVSHPLQGDQLVSMNFWGFTPALFEVLEERFTAFLQVQKDSLKSEFLIPEVVDGLIASNQMKVQVLPTDASWFGVTYPKDKPLVRAALAKLAQEKAYPRPLWPPL